MSISKKLDETLEKLELTESAAAARKSVISRSMGNLKEKMHDLDLQIKIEKPEIVIEQKENVYENDKMALAEVARKVYRDNINPKEVKEKAPKEQPSTIASRANVSALSRSLAGMRTSGNEGKTSFVGSNGSGNVGKLSPTGANGSGNVTNNFNNYYALTTDMTLEEYEEHVNNIFNEGKVCPKCGKDPCECDKTEKTKKEIESRGGPPGYKDISMNKEDVVHELEDRLVTMGSTDWIVVDQVLREFAHLLDITPRTLSRDFKALNGVYPDKWIKEHMNLEICGYMPLEEAARLNKIGAVYEVTFMYRGGTNRLKFFWPMPGAPSKEQMQYEVEKFWPKGKLIAFYRTIDNTEMGNMMVMAPPMTENFVFQQPEEWNELSEEASGILKTIYEEEGEPVSPIYKEDEGYSVIIEDHDTGEERQVIFSEGGLHAWFSKSKSKDGKGGWVQSDGSTCARKPGQTSAPKCYSSQRLSNLKKSAEGKKKIRSADARKKSQDSGQSSKTGAAKPTMVKTFTDPKDKKKYKSGDQTLKDESFDPTIDEACWAGYTQKGMKTMFGKQYPNCVKKSKIKKEETEVKESHNKPETVKGIAKELDKAVEMHKSQAKRLRKSGVSEETMLEGMKEFSEAIYGGAEAEKKAKLDKAKKGLVPGRGVQGQYDQHGREYDTNTGKLKEDVITEGGIKSGHKRKTEDGAGLTQKGVDAENAKTGGNLQTAVTTPPSKLKAGSKAAGRRKSFCARSRSWDGERGKAARRRWNC